MKEVYICWQDNFDTGDFEIKATKDECYQRCYKILTGETICKLAIDNKLCDAHKMWLINPVELPVLSITEITENIMNDYARGWRDGEIFQLEADTLALSDWAKKAGIGVPVQKAKQNEPGG